MKRLTSYEREQIALFNSQGLGVREIAQRINRDHSVISRELRRNRGQLTPYEAVSAQYFAERRSHKTNLRKLEKHEELRIWVRDRLGDKWSPEQIAGRLKNHPPKRLKGFSISHEAIYQWIYTESPRGEPWLYNHLRRKHWDRQPRFGRKKRSKSQLKELVSISLRPETKGVGDLEIDSIVGKNHHGGLSVHYDRFSQWSRIHLLTDLKAEETTEALHATLEDLPMGIIRTLTFDRGSETSLHYQLREPYKLMTYHCDPYCPYQKGGVEHQNSLIRQFFPKKTDFLLISSEEVQFVEDLLNNRPRKKLSYQTPNEVMSGALNP